MRHSITPQRIYRFCSRWTLTSPPNFLLLALILVSRSTSVSADLTFPAGRSTVQDTNGAESARRVFNLNAANAGHEDASNLRGLPQDFGSWRDRLFGSLGRGRAAIASESKLPMQSHQRQSADTGLPKWSSTRMATESRLEIHGVQNQASSNATSSSVIESAALADIKTRKRKEMLRREPEKADDANVKPPAASAREGSFLESSAATKAKGVGGQQLGVCRWRGLETCSPMSSLESSEDKLCSEAIAPNEKGFCDCNGDAKIDFDEQQYGCGTSPGRCDAVCMMCSTLVTVNAASRADKRFWRSYCHKIPADAVALRLTMGTLEDYYRPMMGSSWCEMLQSNDKHEWSKDLRNWLPPTSLNITHLLGGSSEHPGGGWQDDARTRLSFWGSDIRTGGCCASSYDDTTTQLEWGKPFVMAACQKH